ncbi:MAG: amidohydrolase, partial [Rhodospirillaceae bacterium]|nr:amidohydrolase [Rhodospirillaceae bacterium]
ATKDPETKVVDLAGKTLLPGFIDAHGHFPFGAMVSITSVDLQSPPVGTLKSIPELIARLKDRAAKTPKGQWIQGAGYDDTLLAEKRHPTRADLDQVSPDHPIYLMHVSGHMAAVNSMALKLAGITKDTQAPTGGKFRTDDATQEPNGVLEESAMFVVAKLLPKISDDQMKAAITRGSQDYLSVGVTTAQNGAATPDDIRHLQTAQAIQALPIRVDVWPQMQFRIAALDKNEPFAPPPDQDLIRFTANKGFADGSIQAFTGYLGMPYHSHGTHEDDYRGYPRAPRETLTQQVVRLHKAGYQVAVHANGDAAIDDLLFAYKKAQDEMPRPDARHIVVHSQMARDDQLDTMKALGVIPSFFNLHVYYWGDRHRDIFIGPERASHISPMRTAIDKGLTITLHADAPVVPMNPLMIVWSAVNRITSSGVVLGPDQRISVAEALKAITLNAAYQGFAEVDKGSLAVGKLADLVILAENPLTVPPQHIKDIAVVETIVGGRSAWRQPQK